MPTNDERREVARRLRELRSGWSSGECYYTIIHALGLPDTSREDGGHALYAALADLIDPGESGQNRDTNRDTVPKESPAIQKAPECDRDALLALADEIEGEGLDGWASGPVNVDDYARRIREALGVTDD